MENINVVILAAGLGKRMHSPLPKALHEVCGQSMLGHVLDAAKAVSDEIICVVGHGRDEVMATFEGRMSFVVQEEQKGTGHAVRMAESLFGTGDVLVLFTDTPLITADTLRTLVRTHADQGNAATLITAYVEDPGSLGRVIRKDGVFQRIVEYKNATEEERGIREINSGIAVFDAALLKEKLDLLSDNNAQGEYLLTDVFEMLLKDGRSVGAVVAESSEEVLGVNDKAMLAEAERLLTARLRRDHMLAGVTIRMPETVYIEKSVRIAPGTVIEQGSRLIGNSSVEADCKIGPFTELRNVSVGKGSTLERTLAVDSVIGAGCKIGPFAYIRPDCTVADQVKIGDFVEVKNTSIGSGTKIPHLSYIGDGEIGERTNIGCGTIFVNYDGEHKHRTKVGSDSFIGCNSNLVAPVEVGSQAFVAAGTTVTKEVADGEFAISRTPQSNRPNRKIRKDAEEFVVSCAAEKLRDVMRAEKARIGGRSRIRVPKTAARYRRSKTSLLLESK